MAWKGTLDGREVTTAWDGNGQSGREASAGIYLLRAESEAGEAMGRLVRVDKLTSLGGVGDVTVPLPATQTNERGFP